jgi:LmbE family N-acetylglucosaminyl deacetylase
MRYKSAVKILRAVIGNRFRTKTPLFLPDLLTSPEPVSILTISPHPDDDILAIGGTLHKHIQAGGTVTSIVLTSGSRGTPDASMTDHLPQLRQAETKKAADILKLTDIQFWDEPDGELHITDELSARMAQCLSSVQPGIIYIPFPIDYHHDHIAATKLMVHVLDKLPIDPVIRCYECIIPLIPNLISDITPVIETKREAVSCFQSQNQVSDYRYTVVEGLNRLRTHGLMKGRGYGEGLFQTTSRNLKQILTLLEHS